jgi:hypothetical protein
MVGPEEALGLRHGPVQGRHVADLVRVPQWYDLAGNVVSGPPPCPLPRLAVNVRGEPGQEDIVVSRT